MPLHTNYFKIGLFVMAAFVLLAAGLAAFGLSGAFKPQLRCVTFFDQSVQGLSEGSAVKFRGFRVGQVTGIALSRLNAPAGKQLVRVMFYIDPTALVGPAEDTVAEARDFIQAESEAGLRVFLSMQGVTGVGFLNLDYDDQAARHANFAGSAPPEVRPEVLYIPNAPGRVMEIGESVSEIVKSLGGVDFAGLSRDLKALVERVDRLAANFQDHNVAETTTATLTGIRDAALEVAALVKNLDDTLGGSQFRAVGDELKKSMTQLRLTLKRTEQLLSAPQGNLPATMDNLRVMSENLRDLSELAKKYPSQLLFGGAPQEVQSGGKN